MNAASTGHPPHSAPPHTGRFPSNFVWGAATSAYQIEGATTTDGRTDSIWDTFARREGAVFQRQSGEPACGHYHRLEEDVGLMRRIGLQAYRFSIAWPRVQPLGPSSRNDAGLAFYDRLVDALLGAKIEPWVTLYHWDMPAWAFERGGLLNRDFALWFADYAALVVDRLSDRVSHWMTLNEPQVFCKFGYGDGTNAPGLRLSLEEQLQAVHVSLLAHGRACRVIRARAKRPARVGWAVVGRTDFPVGRRADGADVASLSDGPMHFVPPSEADIAAARRSMMAITTRDLWNNTWYNDPVFFGEYPEDGLSLYAPAAPKVEPGDMELIRQPLDFLGVNIYDGRAVRAGDDGTARVVPFAPGHPQTLIRWFITPPALRYGPRFLHERYRVPVYITENGLSCMDWVQGEGTDARVSDPQRVDYTRRYLIELSKAVADGAEIGGYFHWSLLDNFEWAEGYQQRFGLVHVDIPTGRRTLKDSALWYQQIIASNGAKL